MNRNRRIFMQTLATASLLSAAGLRTGVADSAGAEFRLALQTYSLKELDLHYLLPVVSRLGFDRIETFDRQLSVHSSQQDLTGAVADLDSAGIEAAAFYTDEFGGDELLTHAIFAFGVRIGIELFSTGREPAALTWANELSGRYGIPVALHNASPGPGKHYVSLEDIDATLAELQHLRVCIDVGNFVRAGIDPLHAIRHFGPRVVEVHIKDVDADGNHTLLGEGVVDLVGVLDALAGIGFSGLLTLEYGGEPDDITARIDSIAENARRLRKLAG